MFLIKLIIWPSFWVKLVNTIKGLLKKTLNFCSLFQRPFKIWALLWRNQSIFNLFTILSWYSRLQYSYFLSRIVNNYIDLMASYLLREQSFLITEEILVFFAFMYVLLKNNTQVEFEYLHSVNLLCMRSFNINSEYITGVTLQ